MVPHKTPTDPLSSAAISVRAAFSVAPVDESMLKNAICGYVDEAKRMGWPVERVIVDIKRMAEAGDGPLMQARDATTRLDAQALISRAVTWAVDHYYWTG
jgi:hypothetical protein